MSCKSCSQTKDLLGDQKWFSKASHIQGVNSRHNINYHTRLIFSDNYVEHGFKFCMIHNLYNIPSLNHVQREANRVAD